MHVEGLDDVLVRLSRCCTPVPGDEIIGLFGAPVTLPDAADRAIRCGLEMQRALAEFNRVRRSAEM